MFSIIQLDGKFATNIFFSKIKSICGNTYCQVFFQKVGFKASHPKISATGGDSLGEALDDFVHDFGAPMHLTFDGHQSQVGKKMRFFQGLPKYKIDHHVSSPRHPNANPAEGTIREIKRCFYIIMKKLKIPKQLWDYLIVWISETSNLSISSTKYASGRTPIEIITGDMPDISEYLDFSFTTGYPTGPMRG